MTNFEISNLCAINFHKLTESIRLNDTSPEDACWKFIQTHKELESQVENKNNLPFDIDKYVKLAIKNYTPYFVSIINTEEYRKYLNGIFEYALLIHIRDNSLERLKNTLMSIQAQTLNEDTFFNVSKLQIICWGDISDEILKYNYSAEYPRIDDNLIFVNIDSYSEANTYRISNKTGAIESGIILTNNVELYKYYIKGGRE